MKTIFDSIFNSVRAFQGYDSCYVQLRAGETLVQAEARAIACLKIHLESEEKQQLRQQKKAATAKEELQQQASSVAAKKAKAKRKLGKIVKSKKKQKAA